MALWEIVIVVVLGGRAVFLLQQRCGQSRCGRSKSYIKQHVQQRKCTHNANIGARHTLDVRTSPLAAFLCELAKYRIRISVAESLGIRTQMEGPHLKEQHQKKTHEL